MDIGITVYDNGDGSSTVPVVHKDGALQITTVIANSEAPTRFDYPMSLGGGMKLHKLSNGGAQADGAYASG